MITVKYLNPTFSQISGDILPLLKYLTYEKVYYKQGQYRKERKTHQVPLIKKGIFLTGFIPRIKQFCENNNIQIEVEKGDFDVPISNKKLTGVTLRNYQKEAVKTFLKEKRGVILSPTGSGKTLMAISVINHFPKSRALFIVHTKTLLKQTLTEFKKFFKSKEIGVVGDSEKDLSKRITIGMIQSLHRMLKSKDLELKKFLIEVEVIVTDECFKKGTKIITIEGEKNIEDIKKGELVLSEKGWEKVTNTFTNKIPYDKIIRISLSNRKKIICTKNHLFKIGDKWIPAIDLLGKKVFTNKKASVNMLSDNISDTNKQEKTNYETNSKKNLPHLWKKILSQKKQTLLKNLYVQKSRKEQTKLRNFQKDQCEIQRTICKRKSSKQPYVPKRNNRKNDDHKKNKSNFECVVRKTRWKWKTYPDCTTNIICGSRLAYRGNCTVGGKKKRKRRLADLLQDRRCQQKNKIWDRSRWEKSRQSWKESTRRKERKEIREVRVEDIKIFKQGSEREFGICDKSNKMGDKKFVDFYDLEVENQHCYYAEGVLVHNCHHISLMNGTYADILCHSLAPIRLGVTATKPYIPEAIVTLEGCIGPTIYEVDMNLLIEDGKLAKPKLKFLKAPDNPLIKEIKRYQEVYETAIVHNRSRNKMIILEAGRLFEEDDLTSLIIVSRIEHGRNLESIANAILPDLRIEFIHGATEGDVRETVRSKLHNKQLDIVIVTAIFREGVDVPSLGAVINAAGGKSEIATIQALGRGLRSFEGKTEVVLVDILDTNHNYLISHLAERLTLYSEKNWL